MNYSHTARLDNIALHAGPSPLGAWLGAALRSLVHRGKPKPAAGDREREAAEVRAWAMTLQRTDPRFAADLFAAADRHEAQAT